MVILGTHLGPIFHHHADGVFWGAMDSAHGAVDYGATVPLTDKAGSITSHHARTIHGSAASTSDRPRHLLLHQYRAADAWPLLGLQQTILHDYRAILLSGEDTLEPRVTLPPVCHGCRWLPPAVHQGSVYDNQGAGGAVSSEARSSWRMPEK